jgi:hypothetical protein
MWVELQVAFATEQIINAGGLDFKLSPEEVPRGCGDSSKIAIRVAKKRNQRARIKDTIANLSN